MTKANQNLHEFRSMTIAPRDGTKVRLRLKDGFGTFQIKAACAFRAGRWVNAKSSNPIVPEVIGWKPYIRQGGYDD